MNATEVIRCRPRNEVDMAAVLVTAENMAEVAAWSGGVATYRADERPGVMLDDQVHPDLTTWAELGMYVVRGCTGHHWAMEAAAFERGYEVLR